MIEPPRRLAAAVTGLGIALCILGWYQIAGQPTVPQQLPYLASATIPGAVLLGSGVVLLLRAPAGQRAPRGGEGAGTPGAPLAEAARRRSGGLWRVPDGRYVHGADCPLLDGRTDVLPAEAAAADGETAEAAEPALRPCPLCHAEAAGAERA